MARIAIVLFNLGGPDGPDDVRPFLFNLFNDPAILPPPQPIRWLLARLISSRRAPVAREIYANMGGGSPLLANTRSQATALEGELADLGEARVFIAMRYWHPRALETAQAVKAFAPDKIVLLPLYPQFSTTSSGSSLQDWWVNARRAGLDQPTVALCCYPSEAGLMETMVDAMVPAIQKAALSGPPRLLFSAHGLPERVIKRGDPYQWQIERTARALMKRLAERAPTLAATESVVCYQSRATPEVWLKPDTQDEIRRAGGDGRSVVMVPVAFVSEHSETLVELDMEYRELASTAGVPGYERVPTAGTSRAFIAGLGRLIRGLLTQVEPIASQVGPRTCPAEFTGCLNRRRQTAGAD
jgi:protoporphyrin/coproporphyrin ferrochelatase